MIKLQVLDDDISLPFFTGTVEKDIQLLSCEGAQMLDGEDIRETLRAQSTEMARLDL